MKAMSKVLLGIVSLTAFQVGSAHAESLCRQMCPHPDCDEPKFPAFPFIENIDKITACDSAVISEIKEYQATRLKTYMDEMKLFDACMKPERDCLSACPE